jgi:hypothetical protein
MCGGVAHLGGDPVSKWETLDLCPEWPLAGGHIIAGAGRHQAEWFAEGGEDDIPTHIHFYVTQEEVRAFWRTWAPHIPDTIKTCSFQLTLGEEEWIKAWNHSREFLAWIEVLMSNQLKLDV